MSSEASISIFRFRYDIDTIEKILHTAISISVSIFCKKEALKVFKSGRLTDSSDKMRGGKRCIQVWDPDSGRVPFLSIMII